MTVKGTTTQRGYGVKHVAKRNEWKPLVAAGRVMCHAKQCLMPHRLILPGTAWDLGHTEDRTTWTGPEHQLCNRADGGRRRSRPKTRRRWIL